MKAFVFLPVILLLAACAGPKQIVVEDITATDEIAALKQEFTCAWESYPDVFYPAKGKAYMCVLDKFKTVTFYLEPSEHPERAERDLIDRVTLVWQAWHEGQHLVDGRIEATRAIAYVAGRFFPDHMAVDVIKTFLGQQNKVMTHAGVKAVYNYEEQSRLDLHQMDITGVNFRTRRVNVEELDAALSENTTQPPAQEVEPNQQEGK